MNRTVRDDNGASLLLKKDAVRAKATASSLVLTVVPKSPAEVAGVPGFTYTPRIFPPRSVTAIATAAETDFAAFCAMAVTSAAVSWLLGEVAGTATPGTLGAPPPHEASPTASKAIHIRRTWLDYKSNQPLQSMTGKVRAGS